jgi:diguanylate cyclase
MKFDKGLNFKLTGERSRFLRIEGALQQISVIAALAGFGIWIYITGTSLKDADQTAAWALTVFFSLHIFALFMMRGFREKWLDLEKHASTDTLTGIMNRECFERTLEAELRRAGRYHFALTVCILDIDFFGSYNEQFGREKADALLKQFAEFLTGNIRFADCAARFDTDEFILYLPHTDLVGAQKFIKRFQIQTEERLDCGFSAGLTSYQLGEKRSQFLQRAQAALFLAKRAGKKQLRCLAAGQDSETVLSF